MAILEDSLAVSYKTKHALTMWSSNHAFWYLPQGAENICLHNNLHKSVYRSFYLQLPNLEATGMSLVGEWINKQYIFRQWYAIQH